jgi:transcriptional regulator with PAS, ATPase and Fis domain
MGFTKRTISVRDEFYERLRRDGFFDRREIKEILDGILANWIAEHPEQPRRPMAGKLSDSRDQIEIEEIKNAMAQTYNHKSNAAKILGISRMALFNKLKKYGLAFPPYKGKPSKK